VNVAGAGDALDPATAAILVKGLGTLVHTTMPDAAVALLQESDNTTSLAADRRRRLGAAALVSTGASTYGGVRMAAPLAPLKPLTAPMPGVPVLSSPPALGVGRALVDLTVSWSTAGVASTDSLIAMLTAATTADSVTNLSPLTVALAKEPAWPWGVVVTAAGTPQLVYEAPAATHAPNPDAKLSTLITAGVATAVALTVSIVAVAAATRAYRRRRQAQRIRRAAVVAALDAAEVATVVAATKQQRFRVLDECDGERPASGSDLPSVQVVDFILDDETHSRGGDDAVTPQLPVVAP